MPAASTSVSAVPPPSVAVVVGVRLASAVHTLSVLLLLYVPFALEARQHLTLLRVFWAEPLHLKRFETARQLPGGLSLCPEACLPACCQLLSAAQSLSCASLPTSFLNMPVELLLHLGSELAAPLVRQMTCLEWRHPWSQMWQAPRWPPSQLRGIL